VLQLRYGRLIALGSDIADTRFIVRASPNRGYGLFANIVFAKGDYISEYTGIRQVIREQSLDYTWDYVSKPKCKRVASCIGVNSLNSGNLLRFVNHSNDSNCEIIHVLIKRRWHVIYVAKRKILVREMFYGLDRRRVHGKLWR
jgi:SET domain-containing protein